MRGLQGYLPTLIIAFAALLLSCGQEIGHVNGSSANTTPTGLNLQFDLQTALAEIGSYSAPEGVDSAVFAELKNALQEALVARGEGRLVSTPPNGIANAIPDLAMSDAGGGTVNLTWHYYNVGDYNQDGIVNVSDITPIAIHYGEDVPSNPGDENLLLSVINGGSGPKIGIDDITPIAMNYGSEVANYRIETSPTSGGLYTLVQQVAFSSAQDAGTQRAHFQASFTPVNANWYRVVPADSSDVAGVGSNEVLAIASTWVHSWGLPNADETSRMALDESGNLYIAGATSSSGAGGYDVLVLKYSPYGDFIWARTWGGSLDERASAVFFDDLSQKMIVTGNTRSFGNGQADAFLLSYTLDGTREMQKTWGGLNNDYANDIKTRNGAIYIAGNTASFGAGNFDAFVIKLGQTGEVIWQKTWGGTAFDAAIGLSIDSSGNPFIAGVTGSFGGNGNDVLVVEYDSQGIVLNQSIWVTGDDEIGFGIAHDADDNMYVCGSRTSANQNGLLLKYSPSGSVEWVRQVVGASAEAFTSLEVNDFGYAVMCGTTDSTPLGSTDLFFVAIDPAGLYWVQSAWGTTSADRATGIALGADGYLYSAGYGLNADGTWIDPNFTIETSLVGAQNIIAGTESEPTELTADANGISQSPIDEVQDTSAGGTDAVIMKTLLLS